MSYKVTKNKEKSFLNLVDSFNRTINYLRVSITDRCNLKCIYCMSNPPVSMHPHSEILRYEEIVRLIKIGANLGISKIRVTGGEPLVRKGVYDFITEISEINTISDISLTTNGILLKKNIDKIKNAGIKRLNISIDTLIPDKYKKITGSPNFYGLWEGILAAHENGFYPIKLNVVILKGINDDELHDLAKLSFDYPFHIRFIEYMPIGENCLDSKFQMLTYKTKQKIEELGKLIPVKNNKNDGPAVRFKFKKAKGEIGFISPISQHFCSKCNRLRLTATGQLRACLLSDISYDIKKPLRAGAVDSEIEEIFLKTVFTKPLKSILNKNSSALITNKMYSIGG